MVPSDPIVVTVDIVNSPSPLIGSATISSVASTAEAIQLVTQGPKGDAGSTGPSGTAGAKGDTGAPPSDYVISINSVTGAIQNVAKTNTAQTFIAVQGFANGITITGGSTFANTVSMVGDVVLNKDTSRTLTVNGVSTFNQGIFIDRGSQSLGMTLTGGMGVHGTISITGGDFTVRGIKLGRGNFPTNATGPDYNLAIGEGALNSVIPNSPAFTGIYNVAIGYNAMRASTSAGYNLAIGANALSTNTSGAGNVAIGVNSLIRATTAAENNAVGGGALFNTIAGGYNTAIGNLSLNRNIGGQRNVAIGYRAGFASSIPPSLPGGNVSQDSTANPLSLSGANNSVYIGFESTGLTYSSTNEIVIGSQAIGAGTNTATIGNTSVTRTILRGTVDAAGGISAANGISITGGMTAYGNVNFIGSVFLNPPASSPFPSNTTGKTGQITWGLSGSTYYLYLCVDTNTWKNVALNSF